MTRTMCFSRAGFGTLENVIEALPVLSGPKSGKGYLSPVAFTAVSLSMSSQAYANECQIKKKN